MLSLAQIPIPESFQGKDLSRILKGEVSPVRNYLFTENLWSTQFGNPRCEAVQDKKWKYIRYYRNQNISAQKTISVARELGLEQNLLLNTSAHDPDIATYRDYINSSLEGEPPVYEELFHLAEDPYEVVNLANHPKHQHVLEKMRKVWKEQIISARGTGRAKVLRYTID